MNTNLPGSLGEGILYEDVLPCGWQVLSAPPSAGESAHWSAANENVLRLVSALEEFTPDVTDDHGSQSHDLARLEFKLNLVLELVGQLVRGQQALPGARALKLNAHSMLWETYATDSAPAVGQHLLIALYLNDNLPRPLQLHGIVREFISAPSGGRVHVEFHELTESVQDLLEKMIFRHHRRSIAQHRPTRGPLS